MSHLASHAVLFFVPVFYGDGVSQPYKGPDNVVEAAQYIGLLPLYLIAVVWTVKPRPRGASFFASVGACLYLVRLKMPIISNLARMIPLLSIGTPTRLLTLVTFLLAIVAGMGLTALEEPRRVAMRRACAGRALLHRRSSTQEPSADVSDRRSISPGFSPRCATACRKASSAGG